MEGVQNKKLKNLQEKEDRISSLPDSLIHHILSFLPSTKEAIQTGVLSKRWARQWTRVPVLVFNHRVTPFKNCARCIDNTLILYNCSKIKKFHISNPETDSQLTAQIRFATMKCVEELILDAGGSYGKYRLPNFLFSCSSLVKLETIFGRFVPNEKVHWGYLKDLKLLFCELTEDAIKNVLSGSPSLESLELGECEGYDKLVVASESLKKLLVSSFCIPVIEISCSNLVELKLQVLNLKDLKMRVPCLISATLFIGYKYVNYFGEGFEEYRCMVKNILGSISNVKELTLGSGVNMVLSRLSMGAQHSPLFNCKRLSLDVNIYDLRVGIAFVLCHSPVLENLFLECEVAPHPMDLNAIGEDWWNINETNFDCVVSHSKTVTISGLARSDSTYKLVLHFIEFILKNARVLEKLNVILNGKDTDFVIEVSNKLLNSVKCSQHAIVWLCCR